MLLGRRLWTWVSVVSMCVRSLAKSLLFGKWNADGVVRSFCYLGPCVRLVSPRLA